MAGTAQSG
uniref:Uncharacterized protein n=1 Tax=Arundo donax TaxID=35708 RepID=A0A0A9GN02_ARUDO